MAAMLVTWPNLGVLFGCFLTFKTPPFIVFQSYHNTADVEGATKGPEEV